MKLFTVNLCCLHTCIILSLLSRYVVGKRNKMYFMPSQSCSSIPREIDGAVITSSTSNYLYAKSRCSLSFMADDDLFTTKKIMVKVERMYFSKACNVRLRFFDGSSTSLFPMRSLDCRSSKPAIFYTSGKYLTISLDKKVNSGYDFKIVLTSVKRKRYCDSDEMRCSVGYCADRDLQCDGIGHCPSNTDETICSKYRGGSVGMGMGAMTGLGIAVFLVCIIGVIITVICWRRRGYSGRVLRSGQSTSVTTSTTVAPPPGPVPYQQPGYGVPYPQQPPAYYPQQPPPPTSPGYPPQATPGYPQQAVYPPPPAYPGYPPQAVNYNAQAEMVKVPH